MPVYNAITNVPKPTIQQYGYAQIACVKIYIFQSKFGVFATLLSTIMRRQTSWLWRVFVGISTSVSPYLA